MAEPLIPDVVVNICHNCLPQAGKLPRQWKQDGSLVSIREIPCSGKIDVQYLLHALEGVRGGVCVVACPVGECHLAQGNQRAEVRVATARRLLAEIGIEPDRAMLLHASPQEPITRVEQEIRAAVKRLADLGPSPLQSGARREPAPQHNPSAGPEAPAERRGRALPT